MDRRSASQLAILKMKQHTLDTCATLIRVMSLSPVKALERAQKRR